MPVDQEKLTDSKEILDLVREAADLAREIAAWNAGREMVARGTLDLEREEEGNVLRLALDGAPDAESLIQSAAKNIGEMHTLLFLMGARGIYASKLSVQKVKGKRIEYAWPTQIARIQRRASPRFEIPKAYELWAGFKRGSNSAPPARAKLEDLSDSGFSFCYSDESEPFQKGETLLQGELLLRGERIRFEAEVVHLTQKRNREEPSVGCRFTKILEREKRILSNFVLRQAFHFLK